MHERAKQEGSSIVRGLSQGLRVPEERINLEILRALALIEGLSHLAAHGAHTIRSRGLPGTPATQPAAGSSAASAAPSHTSTALREVNVSSLAELE